MPVEPYLFFDGCCEEALEFYKKTLGAEVTTLMRFRENPDADQKCGVEMEEKVMHTQMIIQGTSIMASDGMCTGKPAFSGFSLALSFKEVAEVERIFNALLEGGQVQMPLSPTFWSPMFGMVADRFGVSWMVMADSEDC